MRFHDRALQKRAHLGRHVEQRRGEEDPAAETANGAENEGTALTVTSEDVLNANRQRRDEQDRDIDDAEGDHFDVPPLHRASVVCERPAADCHRRDGQRRDTRVAWSTSATALDTGRRTRRHEVESRRVANIAGHTHLTQPLTSVAVITCSKSKSPICSCPLRIICIY